MRKRFCRSFDFELQANADDDGIVVSLGLTRTTAAIGASALTGALLMALADAAARTVAFPILLPTGVTAAIVSCPVLLFLLQRRRRSA